MSTVRRPSLAKRVYLLCGLALIATNVWSLVVVSKLRQRDNLRPPGVTIDALPTLRQVKLGDGMRPLQDLGQSGSYVLLVLLSPFDCPTAIEELEEIQRLHMQAPWIDIRALMSNVSAEEARQTEERFHLTFPVIADQDGKLRNVLHPPQTPWKVLFNPTTGDVMLEDGPSIAPEEKTAFHNRVGYLLRGAQNLEGPRL